MRRARGLVVAACLLSTGAAAGENAPIRAPEAASIASPSPPGEIAGPPPAGRALEAETEVTLDRSTRVAAGLAFGGPIGAAASVLFLHGLSADVRDDETRVEGVCAAPIAHCAQGFLFQVEAGSGGGKVSMGVGARARVDEEDFHGTVGFGLRASLVRTWGSPLATEPGLTYLGPELDLSIMKVDLTLGVLWRLGGHAGASALVSWGVGFGL